MIYYNTFKVLIMKGKKVCVQYVWVYVVLSFNVMMWMESSHHHIYCNGSVDDTIRLIMMLLRFVNKINH